MDVAYWLRFCGWTTSKTWITLLGVTCDHPVKFVTVCLEIGSIYLNKYLMREDHCFREFILTLE